MGCLQTLFFMMVFTFSLPGIFMAQEKNEEEKEEKSVLVFYKTEGFWHESIPTGCDMIESLGEDHGFKTEITKDAADFRKDDFMDYDLVIFLSTTGNVFDEKEQAGFKKYMEEGGNFFGIHAAADTEPDWEWYRELVGGFFAGHPAVQSADVINNAPNHPTVSHLPERWSRVDEWYNYETLNPDNKILLYLDENSYEGGTNGKEHPIAWYRELDAGGVAIYTGGGHTSESYWELEFQEHLLRCIKFALDEEVSID